MGYASRFQDPIVDGRNTHTAANQEREREKKSKRLRLERQGWPPQAPPPVQQRAVAVCVMLSTGPSVRVPCFNRGAVVYRS